MTQGPLQNYLRTHRRKTGLSQEDMAKLLGAERDTTVSRHESGQRLPALEMAIAYELVYQVPLRELFAGQVVEVGARVRRHANRLLEETNGTLKGPRAQQKLETLIRLSESDEPVVVPLWHED